MVLPGPAATSNEDNIPNTALALSFTDTGRLIGYTTGIAGTTVDCTIGSATGTATGSMVGTVDSADFKYSDNLLLISFSVLLFYFF